LKNIIAANKRKKEKLQKKLAKMNNKIQRVPTASKEREGKRGRKTAWVVDAIPKEILVPGMDFEEEEEKAGGSDDHHEENEWDEYGEKVLKKEDERSTGKGPETLEDNLSPPLGTDLDEQKKRDLSLRVAIETIDTPLIRWGFAVSVLTALALCFLYQSSTQADYTMRQSVLIYGEYNGEIAIKSGGILLFALFLDTKEIYQTLRSIIPLYSAWIPLVTIDTTYDVNSLFIGNKTVSLLDVSEAHTFSSAFICWCYIGYLLGCFPWALFTMILRNQYLSFDVTRITNPLLGTIVMIRAILGPSFIIKSAFATYSLFNLSLKGREDLGLAFKAKKTTSLTINLSIFLSCGCAFLLSIVALRIATLIFGVFLLLGAVYGAITGCSHSLPIHPWMIITTIGDGVWLRLKEKKRCPCVYWCGYCTDMHDYDEVFVIFPRDQIQFLSKLKGNTETNNV
jgi:hypothetical protein